MPYKTLYFPKNTKKYVGNHKNIRCRSLWERRFCKYLDENTTIVKWGFETIKIPYLSPIDNNIHIYIPDFIFETEKDKEITIVEIKPSKQTKEPTSTKNKRAFIRECSTYSVNLSKWQSASRYCEDRGWKFKIVTEKDLF